MMIVHSVDVKEFDRRAAAGDSMSEFFTEYSACDLDVDGLIDEIFAEQQSFVAEVERAPAPASLKARAKGKLKRPLPTYKDAKDTCILSQKSVNGQLEQVLFTMVDPQIREAVCLFVNERAARGADVRQSFEKAALAGHGTYISPETRERKSRSFEAILPLVRAAMRA